MTILMVLWSKLDKRFEDFEASQNKQFDESQADMQEMGAGARHLGGKRLSIKT